MATEIPVYGVLTPLVLPDAPAGTPTDNGLYVEDGQVYLAVDGELVPVGVGGDGGGALDDLTDVVAPTPADGDALVWDAGTSKWIPGAVAGGGGSGATEVYAIPGEPTPGSTALLWVDTDDASLATAPVTTGGIMSTVGTDVLHTFTVGGSFVTDVAIQVTYLIVAGGGGGGTTRGGGGGGGGVLAGSTILAPGTYTVTIGAGGAGAAAGTRGVNGSNSAIAGVGTAIGGGGGATTDVSGSVGAVGGSGGGGGAAWPGSGPGGAGTAGQGYAGGDGYNGRGGGGGGAGGVGEAHTTGGDGGPGAASSITGVSVAYAGGGGGSADGSPGVGSGGGGNGGDNSTAPQSGTANTGGGGGANYMHATAGPGSGGSGVVILRYDPTAGGEGSASPATAPPRPAYVRGTDGLYYQITGTGGSGGGGGATVLDDLTDVVAPTPADGDALVWDAGTSKWIPGAVEGGDGGGGGGYTGAWSSSVAYPAGSIVTYDDRTWGASADIAAGQPPPVAPDPVVTAVPVATDMIADAPSITIATTGDSASSSLYSNATYGMQAGEPNVGGAMSKSGWLKYTPASSGTVIITTLGSTGDSYMSLFEYTGSGGPISFADLLHIETDDGDAGGGDALITLPVAAGKTYYVQAGGWAGATMNMQVNISNARATSPPTSPWVPLATISGGLDQATADTRYVNVTGDTMTGALGVTGIESAASGAVSVAVTNAHEPYYPAGSRAVTVPGGTIAGDVLIMVNTTFAAGSGPSDLTSANGFTSIGTMGQASGSTLYARVYARTADASTLGGATLTFTWTGNWGGNITLLSLRGVVLSSAVYVFTQNSPALSSAANVASAGDRFLLSLLTGATFNNSTAGVRNTTGETNVTAITQPPSGFPGYKPVVFLAQRDLANGASIPATSWVADNYGFQDVSVASLTLLKAAPPLVIDSAGVGTAFGGPITVPTPSIASHAATKGYVDASGGGGGVDGSVILSGTATPTDVTGDVGNYYLDTDDQTLYGPKAAPPGGYVDVSVHATPTTPNGEIFSGGGIELGLKITCGAVGFITGFRYYRGEGAQTSRTLKLWDVTGGMLLGSASTTGETGLGWFTTDLTTPVAVAAGQQVVVSFDGINSIANINPGGFPITNAPLTATSAVNGTSGSYPSGTSFATVDILIDVIFNSSLTTPAPIWPVALTSGSVILSGTSTPIDATGTVDNYYLDTDDQTLYGPKGTPPPVGSAPLQLHTSQVPLEEYNGTNSIRGNKFTCAQAGFIHAIWYYRKGTISQTSRTLKLWNVADQALLASKTTSVESGDGWRSITLDSPVAVTAGQQVIVSFWATAYLPAMVIPSHLPKSNGSLTMTASVYAGSDVYPNGGDGNTNDFFVDITFSTLGYLPPPTWPVALTSGSAGGGLQTRATASRTTASLAAGAAESGTIQLADGYRLYRITTSTPARVRLYTTATKQAADLSRSIGTDPTGDHGLMLEFVTTAGLLTADLSPLVDGFDGKATPDGAIPITVTNTGAAPGAITTDFQWIRTE